MLHLHSGADQSKNRGRSAMLQYNNVKLGAQVIKGLARRRQAENNHNYCYYTEIIENTETTPTISI
jgi:hypothetical protein